MSVCVSYRPPVRANTKDENAEFHESFTNEMKESKKNVNGTLKNKK